MQLIIPEPVHQQICEIVSATEHGLETGVSLFGVSQNSPVILAVAGPGPRATHESTQYSSDTNYTNAVFGALRTALPAITWMGELHVHPAGMTWLSSGDLRTVRDILLGTDDTLHPETFIAGVMQRRRDRLDIYPYYFSRAAIASRTEPLAMEVDIVKSAAAVIEQARKLSCGGNNDRPSIRTKPEGSRGALEETRSHRWPRQWWKRLCAYGGPRGRGEVDADRS